jgi:hypothetical protein
VKSVLTIPRNAQVGSTSARGLLPFRELDDALGLTEIAGGRL